MIGDVKLTKILGSLERRKFRNGIQKACTSVSNGRDNGYANTMVYLAGKDDQGRTIQLEEDGTKHVHKGRTGGPYYCIR